MRLIDKAMVAAVALAVAGAPCLAQSPDEGHQLAKKLCSNCHAVDGMPVARADVPAFRSIANKPTTTPERLASAIVLPHPEMPNIPLTRAEIRAVITYIMSLRK